MVVPGDNVGIDTEIIVSVALEEQMPFAVGKRGRRDRQRKRRHQDYRVVCGPSRWALGLGWGI